MYFNSRKRIAASFLVFISCIQSAKALDLDWSGQFRSETHFILNSNLGQGQTYDSTRAAALGYYVPGAGSDNAYFSMLWMRLNPTIIVNDNIRLKSEWWMGSPSFGFYGGGAPGSLDQRQFYSNQSGGSFVRVQRVWADILTDFGTFQMGRMPLNYGLGLVWNSGDSIWSRYLTTADGFRMTSKFGSFSLSPGFYKYSTGNSATGACESGVSDALGRTCFGKSGIGDVNEYSLMLVYENLEDDVELGLNFIRRIGGSVQDSNGGYFGVLGRPDGVNYNLFDIYGKKKFKRLSLATEIPVTQGTVGPVSYNTVAIATETEWNINDTWITSLKLGYAPGQSNIAAGAEPDAMRAFYFNPNYRIGLIMFNYAFHNFAGPNTENNPSYGSTSQLSPFDNPIVNAQYLAWTMKHNLEKWSFYSTFIYAQAHQAATADGGKFFNTWYRRYVQTTGSTQAQSKVLGYEVDVGASFKWDDHLTFMADFGWWLPGNYYRFNNNAPDNALTSVFASTLKAGIHF